MGTPRDPVLPQPPADAAVLETLANLVEEAAVLVGPDRRITWVNRAARELLGDVRPEGGRCHEVLLNSETRTARCRERCPLSPGAEPHTADHTLLGGEHVRLRTVPVPSEDGGTPSGLHVFSDRTPLFVLQQALEESTDLYRTVLENTEDMVFLVDADGTTRFLNASARRHIGLDDDLTGISIWHFWCGESVDLVRSAVADVAASAAATSIDCVCGDVMYELGLTPAPAEDAVGSIVCVARDVSERIRVERELRQESKLRAIGQLAGGIAHDFNNLLAVILLNASLLQENLTGDEQTVADLDVIRKASEGAAALTRQLLAFSRREIVRPETLDVHAVISEVAAMLRRLLPEDLELRIVPNPSLGPVRADHGHLTQVLINLVVNARDAMTQGGLVTVAATEVEFGHGPRNGGPRLSPGRYVVISVADTGTGMPPEVVERAFEPFFTTKAEGRGTGLGLSTVHGVVSQMGGDVTVSSTVGEGSTFYVHLPSARRAADEETSTPRGLSSAPLPANLVVLVAEDNQGVRKTICRILARSGANVVEAASAEEALALWAEQKGAVDLLLTDVVMPGMSGHQLAGRLRDERPGLRTLYISGHADEVITQRGMLQPGINLLRKPFTPRDLVQAVADALG